MSASPLALELGQLADARALIVGVGGLGCPASLALAQSGVGHLTLVDPDRVDPTNLHRQLWFRDSDVGKLKAEVAASRLRAAFPKLSAAPLVQLATPDNLDSLLRDHSVVIDGTDRIESKFALSDAAMRTGIAVVYGGALRMEGQAMLLSSQGPCLRCLFEEPPSDDLAGTCAGAGVLGSLAGVIGATQALIALSVLRGNARPGQLFAFDGATLKQRILIVSKRADCDCCAAAVAVERRLEHR